MYRLTALFLTIMLTSLIGCSRGLEYYPEIPEIDNVADDTRSVLIVGNSYSRDAFSYVPALLEEAGIECDISIICINGKTLSSHYDALLYNQARFEVDSYDNEKHRWHTYTDTTAMQTLSSKDWKLIIFQDGGNAAKEYKIVSANVINIKSFFTRILPNAHFSFMINPPHPLGHSSLNGGSNNDEFYIIVQNAQALVNDNIVLDLIPCGTAIQNARQTELQPLGDYGDLSYEGKHLQEGLPCLTEAYVGAQFIANFFSLPYKIDDNELKVDQTWITRQHIPGRHGKSIIGNDVQTMLSKQSAKNAIESPLQISNKNNE